jgi:hypothetical protein
MPKPIESLSGDDIIAFREALRPHLNWLLNDENIQSADGLDAILAEIDAAVVGVKALQKPVLTVLGSDLSSVTSLVVGTLLDSGNPTNAGRVQLSVPVSQAGFTGRVEWSMTAAGMGALYAAEMLADGTYKVIYVLPVTAVAGNNAVDITDAPYISSAGRWGYERFTGGSVRYQATAGVIGPYLDAAAVGAVGDIAAVAGISPVTIAMRITQVYAPAPITSRVANAQATAEAASQALAALQAAAYPLADIVGDVRPRHPARPTPVTGGRPHRSRKLARCVRCGSMPRPLAPGR